MAENPDSKKVDKGWQKEAGLDLRLDKAKIYKAELSSAKKETRMVPKTDSANVHAHAVKRLKKTKALTEEDIAWRGLLKKIVFNLIQKLETIGELSERLMSLREIEGYIYGVLQLNGSFDENEADLILDCAIRHHERPGSHPLQTATVFARFPKSVGVGSVKRSIVYSHPSLKKALTRRGFYLNNGPFSASESLTLMNNFEAFLTRKGHTTDPKSIWNFMKEDFAQFYEGNKMFLYIGTNLNRTSDQIYRRLQHLYHQEKRSAIPASEDTYVLEAAKALKNSGLHKRFKAMGNEMGRFSVQVYNRHKALTEGLESSSAELIDQDELFKMIDDFRGSLDDISIANFADKLGCSIEGLEKYWAKEGKRKYVRSKLPRWTLEDSDLLLEKVGETEEEDEKCVDFKMIFEQHFREKCADWRHLLDYFSRLRRDVPFYMLNDLQSVVRAVRKDIKEKILKSAVSGSGDGKMLEKGAAVGKEEEEEDDDLMLTTC